MSICVLWWMASCSGGHEGPAGFDSGADAAVDAHIGEGGDGGEPANLAWHTVYEPFEDAWLLSGWGIGPGEVWLAGGPPDAPVLLRGADDVFDLVPVRASASLWWVWGFGRAVLYAVGEGATLLRSDDAGTNFVPQDGPLADATYWGVWGSSPNDVWVVGGIPQEAEEPRGVLLHSAAAGAFEVVDPLDEPLPALFKVWGASADDVWVVGDYGTLLHWNGTDWSRTDLATDDRLTTVAGCSADDVWIVGGLHNGRVLHLEDGEWLDLSPRFAPFLNGVTCAPGVVWVVGWRGYIARRVGDGWEEFVPTNLDLHGVWASGPHDAYAVGGNLADDGLGGRRGVVLHWGPVDGP